MLEGTYNNELQDYGRKKTCEGFRTVCHKYNENKNQTTGNVATLTLCSSVYDMECSLVYAADNILSHLGFHSSGL
jgi:hypothetical protein